MRCPICKKPVDARSELAPFCSERCKLIDLGNWASGKYRVATPLIDEDLGAIEHGHDQSQPGDGDEREE